MYNVVEHDIDPIVPLDNIVPVYFMLMWWEFCFFLWDRFKLALQQNEIMDVFYIDWLHLGDADGNFGNKSDNHLKVMPPCLESMLSFSNFIDILQCRSISDMDYNSPAVSCIVNLLIGLLSPK